MKNLFAAANDYIGTCRWQDIALLKVCLCAFGMMIALEIPPEKKKIAKLASSALFLFTCLPLLYRFAAVWKDTGKGSRHI